MPSSLLAGQMEFVVAAFLVATVVSIAAKRAGVPYTVALVLLGLGAQLLGILPRLHLTPDLVLVVFLPALLFDAAWNLDIRVLGQVWKPVAILATAGVVIAVAGIAAAVHLGDGLAWPAALLLGAALSATDPVSVVAIFAEVKAPRRLVTMVEGESLFNDGTGVAIFQVLLAAVATRRLDLAHVSWEFAYVSAGGLALGLAIGLVAILSLGFMDDHLVGVMLTTVVAYGTYLLGGRLGVSGVLAVVAAGLVMGNAARGRLGLDPLLDGLAASHRLGSVRAISPEIRTAIDSFWEYAAFVANSLLFLLVGLEFVPGPVFERASPFLWALAGMLVSRFALVGLVALGGGGMIKAHEAPILAWGGLRGALSLAMALSLPPTLPGRSTVIAVVYACVLFTLVAQGLSVPWLVKRVFRGEPR